LEVDFQQFSICLADVVDSVGRETVGDRISITRYRLISKSNVIERHINFWCHQGSNSEFLGFYQSGPRRIILIDNICNIETVKTAYHDVNSFMQCNMHW